MLIHSVVFICPIFGWTHGYSTKYLRIYYLLGMNRFFDSPFIFAITFPKNDYLYESQTICCHWWLMICHGLQPYHGLLVQVSGFHWGSRVPRVPLGCWVPAHLGAHGCRDPGMPGYGMPSWMPVPEWPGWASRHPGIHGHPMASLLGIGSITIVQFVQLYAKSIPFSHKIWVIRLIVRVNYLPWVEMI